MHAIKRLAALAVLLIAVPAGAADPDRRADVYREFRQASEAGDYGTALPLARELTQLIEQADPLSKDLPTAYNNLGVAQFRTGELDAAERSFLRALELLETTQGIASRKMISPLAGLGATGHGLRRSCAYPALDRASLRYERGRGVPASERR